MARHHQISRASATAASAPAESPPSLRRKLHLPPSILSPSPSSAPREGSCKGASASPRRSRIGAAIARSRVQNGTSGQRKPPPACRPSRPCLFTSPAKSSLHLSSLLRVASSSRRLLLLCPQQRNHFPTQFHYALQCSRRHPDNLSNKPSMAVKNPACFPAARAYRRRPSDQTSLPARHPRARAAWDRSPAAPFLGHDPEISHTSLMDSKMVAPVAQHVHTRTIRQPCSSRKLRAYVRTRYRQRLRISSAAPARREKQSACHLRHGAVDPHGCPSPPNAK